MESAGLPVPGEVEQTAGQTDTESASASLQDSNRAPSPSSPSLPSPVTPASSSGNETAADETDSEVPAPGTLPKDYRADPANAGLLRVANPDDSGLEANNTTPPPSPMRTRTSEDLLSPTSAAPTSGADLTRGSSTASSYRTFDEDRITYVDLHEGPYSSVPVSPVTATTESSIYSSVRPTPNRNYSGASNASTILSGTRWGALRAGKGITPLYPFPEELMSPVGSAAGTAVGSLAEGTTTSDGPSRSNTAGTNKSSPSSVWNCCGVTAASSDVMTRFLGTKDPIVHLGFAIILIQAIINIAMTSTVIAMHSNQVEFLDGYSSRLDNLPQGPAEWNAIFLGYRTLLSFHIVFLISQFFLVFLFTESVGNHNTVELLAFFVFETATFVYTVFSVFLETDTRMATFKMWPTLLTAAPTMGFPLTTNDSHRILVVTQAALNAVFLTVWFVIGLRVYKAIGWIKFRRIGGDRQVLRRVGFHHGHIVSVKITSFFFLAYVVQWTMLVLCSPQANLSSGETIGIAVSIFSLLALSIFLAFWAVRRQSPVLQMLFLLFLAAGTGYVCYTIYYITAGPYPDLFTKAVTGMLVFMSGALAFSVFTLITGIVNYVFMRRGPQLSWKELEGDPYDPTASLAASDTATGSDEPPSEESVEMQGVERGPSVRSTWRMMSVRGKTVQVIVLPQKDQGEARMVLE